MPIKMTKTQLRNGMKRFGMNRTEYLRSLDAQGSTLENGIWWPLQRWLDLQMTPEEMAEHDRQVEINKKIYYEWSLTDYLKYLNRPLDEGDEKLFQLTEDLEYWKEFGVTTAPELADYLDACHERTMEKERFYG